MSHRPGGLQEEQRRSAFTGPVRAASGAWRRPERPQGLPRAGRTARARGRGRVGAPPAHAAPGEGSAPGGWASDLPASLKYGGGPVLCSAGWRPERAYQKFCPPRPMGKKGASLLLLAGGGKTSRRTPRYNPCRVDAPKKRHAAAPPSTPSSDRPIRKPICRKFFALQPPAASRRILPCRRTSGAAWRSASRRACRRAEGCPRHDFSSDEMPTTLTRSAEQVILVASMIASRLLLGPCAALQQVQVLLEVAIQHHYDIMPAQHFEHRL